MGFGTLNPEPSPGEFDWCSLDTRMQLVKDTGGKAMLTLCCSPDWMKGGPDGATDWDKLERAPLPEHYDDFAKLAAATVQRYPQVSGCSCGTSSRASTTTTRTAGTTRATPSSTTRSTRP